MALIDSSTPDFKVTTLRRQDGNGPVLETYHMSPKLGHSRPY